MVPEILTRLLSSIKADFLTLSSPLPVHLIFDTWKGDTGTSAPEVYDMLALAVRSNKIKSPLALNFIKFFNEKPKLIINLFGKYLVNTYYVQIWRL